MSLSFNYDSVLFQRVQSVFLRDGRGGIKLAAEAFRAAIPPEQGEEMTDTQFLTLLQNLGVKLTPFESKYLVLAFDTGRCGKVNWRHFLRHLRGGLNPRRLALVQRVFAALADDEGKVTVTRLHKKFNAPGHSLTLGVSQENAQAELDRAFGREMDAVVSEEDFIAYYAGISAKTLNDDLFEMMILREWGVDSATHPRLNETVRSWGATGDPLEIRKPLLAKEALSHYALSKAYSFDHAGRVHPPQQKLPEIHPDYLTTAKTAFPAYSSAQQRMADPLTIRV